MNASDPRSPTSGIRTTSTPTSGSAEHDPPCSACAHRDQWTDGEPTDDDLLLRQKRLGFDPEEPQSFLRG